MIAIEPLINGQMIPTKEGDLVPENVKQHIIPKSCILLFSPNGTEVYRRVKGNTDVRLKAAKGQGYEIDAFTVWNGEDRDTSCDDLNKAVENDLVPLVQSLDPEVVPTDKQWRAIWMLTANLLSRSRWARDVNEWTQDRFLEMLPKLQDVVANLQTIPRQFGLSHEEIAELPFDLERARNLLYPLSARLGLEPIAKELISGKSCDLLRAPDGSRFIASDEPGVILNRGQPVFLELAPGFIARDTVEVFLPLTPKLACIWSPKSSRTVRMISEEVVAEFNRFVWSGCYERAFAQRREDLECLPP